MVKTIDVELDSIELQRLHAYSSINNLSDADAIRIIVSERLQAIADSVISDDCINKH